MPRGGVETIGLEKGRVLTPLTVGGRSARNRRRTTDGRKPTEDRERSRRRARPVHYGSASSRRGWSPRQACRREPLSRRTPVGVEEASRPCVGQPNGWNILAVHWGTTRDRERTSAPVARAKEERPLVPFPAPFALGHSFFFRSSVPAHPRR